MNTDSPGALLKKGESEILEFKEGFDKGAIETAGAAEWHERTEPFQEVSQCPLVSPWQ